RAHVPSPPSPPLPIASSPIVTGHVIADLPRAAIGLAVTIGVGVLFGFRSFAGIGAWAAAIGLTLLVTFALSWIAAVIGLLGRSLEVVQQIAAVIIIPICLSNALVPTDTLPDWLRVIVANQPISQATDAIRALLFNQPVGDHLALALIEFAAISIVAFIIATLLFKR